MAARKVWGLGDRICKNDFKRTWTFFRYKMIQSVKEYGIKIWEWEEIEELEKVMLDYIRIWSFVLHDI